MNFPASWGDINTFERKNEGIYVNVFSYETVKIDEEIKNMYISATSHKKRKCYRPVAYFRW